MEKFAVLSKEAVLQELETRESGLSEEEARLRLEKYGANIIHKTRVNILSILIRQFTGNPLIIILAIATFVSYLLGQQISAYYIFGMIIVSILLGFWNEYSAEHTIDSLLQKITRVALIVRDGEKKEISVVDLTIGDIVLLSQGSIIPGDLRLIETRNLEVDESVLTGESKSVYKQDQAVLETSKFSNIAFMGTTVQSGTAKGVVVRIGKDTEFGKIAESATYLKPTTEFQKGLAGFGRFIIKVILLLTMAIFGINAFLGHHIIESLLFSLAIAVGLTPELLPIIVTISLSHGAGKLAKKNVVAKRLISIENLGNMDILCTDKTGTLTEGKIQVVGYEDADGKKSDEVLIMSLLANSAIVHHKVIGNSIDSALWEYAMKNHISPEPSIKKIDEEPFDYNRKLTFSVIKKGQSNFLIVKGAPQSILKLCLKTKNQKMLEKKIYALNQDGLRVILVAAKKVPSKNYSWEDVKNLTYQGYITFLDVPKHTAKGAFMRLEALNVMPKIITGDNEVVTQKICREIGIAITRVVLGSDIDRFSDEELKRAVADANLFAQVTPEQKSKIIQTLQSLGHTVGYLGDGINDIPSLHTADVGISVNSALDAAKESASIVLLRKSLNVIADGIIEGRRTFNNTIKYILMSTSSNFGNMFSAAGASFFLPFLPMTPVQILLTNGLYDVSQMSIPSDNVDQASLIKPRHWNISFIKNYMIFFGPLSSIYDFLTFGIMLSVFHATGPLFQTGWFIESIATEILVVFVIRTSKTPFFLSKPSKWLIFTCLLLVFSGLLIPFSPFAKPLGFISPPPLYFAILIILVSTYLFLVEIVKNIFLKHYNL